MLQLPYQITPDECLTALCGIRVLLPWPQYHITFLREVVHYRLDRLSCWHSHCFALVTYLRTHNRDDEA